MPRAHAGVGRDQHRRARVVDARGEARRREAAEHDRMDGADARAREHCEHGFGDHRHVDQHAVATRRRLAPRASPRSAFTSSCSSRIRVRARLPGFGRDVDQRRLLGARRRDAGRSRCGRDSCGRRRTISRTAAANSRAPASNGVVPVDEARLVAPEGVAIVERAAVEFARRWSCGLTASRTSRRRGWARGARSGSAAAPRDAYRRATRTTVRPRAMPFRYASKCVGSSSKSIVRTWSWTRSGRHSTASLFHSVWRSDIGQFALSVPSSMHAAQDERRHRRVELHVGGEADRRDGAGDLRRREQPRQHVAAEVVDGAGPRRLFERADLREIERRAQHHLACADVAQVVGLRAPCR